MAVLETTQFEQLVSEVKQQLLAESQGVGEVPVVDSLAGIDSLPAKRGSDVVSAPLELLSQPAEEAAARADEAAAQAVQIANDAVSQAQSDIDEAIASAEDTANHPTYVGEDNYVYVWDKTNQTYNKTSVYVRGEGFKVSKTYKSIADMEADTDHGLKEGDFVLINTDDVENPDNAKIYVVDAEGKFTFLVDMSGAIGFTGKTPQIEIGIITTGVGRNDSGATLTDNGLDEEGNPKYLLNLRIPSITLDDLSSEEIALLQSPANDMIAQLEATDNTVKENEDARKEAETLRVEAEESREEAEGLRKQAETVRNEAEEVRKSNENARISNENIRKGAETARISNEDTRNQNEQGRIQAENTRVSSENARNTSEQERINTETAREEAESVRKNNENLRQAQEQSRESAETVRETSESTRISNEGIRQDNESKREASESVRNTNEAARVKAEEDRAIEYALLKEDILEATQNANDAAEESRNTPIIKDGTWWIWSIEQDDYVDTGSPATSKSPQIQNGTWWTWDDANGAYVDTGQSVSADYVLTKEKIEGVFQGNIESHQHDRYVDKVEGKGLSTEDFTTEEKQKLAGLENFDPTDVNNRITELEESMPTKVSDLENDASYVTSTVLEGKDYATNESLNQGLVLKQDKNLYFVNVTASEWVLEGAFKDFKYRCDIPLEGVTENMVAEVIFAMDESSSGNYAPLCETGNGTLTIWSSTNKAIVIPTIIINK